MSTMATCLFKVSKSRLSSVLLIVCCLLIAPVVTSGDCEKESSDGEEVELTVEMVDGEGNYDYDHKVEFDGYMSTCDYGHEYRRQDKTLGTWPNNPFRDPKPKGVVVRDQLIQQIKLKFYNNVSLNVTNRESDFFSGLPTAEKCAKLCLFIDSRTSGVFENLTCGGFQYDRQTTYCSPAQVWVANREFDVECVEDKLDDKSYCCNDDGDDDKDCCAPGPSMFACREQHVIPPRKSSNRVDVYVRQGETQSTESTATSTWASTMSSTTSSVPPITPTPSPTPTPTPLPTPTPTPFPTPTPTPFPTPIPTPLPTPSPSLPSPTSQPIPVPTPTPSPTPSPTSTTVIVSIQSPTPSPTLSPSTLSHTQSVAPTVTPTVSPITGGASSVLSSSSSSDTPIIVGMSLIIVVMIVIIAAQIVHKRSRFRETFHHGSGSPTTKPPERGVSVYDSPTHVVVNASFTQDDDTTTSNVSYYEISGNHVAKSATLQPKYLVPHALHDYEYVDAETIAKNSKPDPHNYEYIIASTIVPNNTLTTNGQHHAPHIRAIDTKNATAGSMQHVYDLPSDDKLEELQYAVVEPVAPLGPHRLDMEEFAGFTTTN